VAKKDKNFLKLAQYFAKKRFFSGSSNSAFSKKGLYPSYKLAKALDFRLPNTYSFQFLEKRAPCAPISRLLSPLFVWGVWGEEGMVRFVLELSFGAILIEVFEDLKFLS